MSKTRMFKGNKESPEETSSPQKTIVGGRPSDQAVALPPVPTGIQSLLRLAAVDTAFRAEFIERRSELAQVAGVTLTPTEQLVLQAVPAAQLTSMIDSMPPPDPSRRTFLRQTASSAVLLLGGAALSTSTGCKPTEQKTMPAEKDTGSTGAPSSQTESASSALNEQQPPREMHRMQAPGGAAPDYPPPKPPDKPKNETDGGSKPDEPPPQRPETRNSETEGGAAPDEPPPKRPKNRNASSKGGARPH